MKSPRSANPEAGGQETEGHLKGIGRFFAGRLAYLGASATLFGLSLCLSVPTEAQNSATEFNPEIPFALAMWHVEGQRFALVSRNGEFLRGPDLVDIEPYRVGPRGKLLARAKSAEELWGFLDTKAQWVVKPEFSSLSDFNSEGVALYRIYDEYEDELLELGEVSLLGQPRKKLPLTEQHTFEDSMAAPPNPTGLEEFSQEAQEEGGERLWGYKDSSGKIVVPAQFTYTYPFTAGGVAVVETTDGLRGLIDRTGQWVEKPIYDRLRYNDEGFAFFAKKLVAHEETATKTNGRSAQEERSKEPKSVLGQLEEISKTFEDIERGATEITELRGYFDQAGQLLFQRKSDLDDSLVCGRVVEGVRTKDRRHSAFTQGPFRYLNEQGQPVNDHLYSYARDFGESCVTFALKERFGIVHPNGKFIPFATALSEPMKNWDFGLSDFDDGFGILPVINDSYDVDYYDTEGRLRFRLRFVEEGEGDEVDFRGHLETSEGKSLWVDPAEVAEVLVPDTYFGLVDEYRGDELKALEESAAGQDQAALPTLVTQLTNQKPQKFAATNALDYAEREYTEVRYSEDDYRVSKQDVRNGAIAELVSVWLESRTVTDLWATQHYDEMFEAFEAQLTKALGKGETLESELRTKTLMEHLAESTSTSGRRPAEILTKGEGLDAYYRVSHWKTREGTVVLQYLYDHEDGEAAHQIFLAVLK